MKWITPKKGLRVLGIAESFLKKSPINKSLLAGVVMRADLQIDGFGFSLCTVGGLDATDAVLSIYNQLGRPDVRVIVLSGTIISLYNIIDLNKLYECTGAPIIAVSYEESSGIEKFLVDLPDAEKRIEIYRRNGPRIPVRLRSGYIVYIRPVGITITNATNILNLFAIHGRYIEPLRVSRLLARSLFRFLFLQSFKKPEIPEKTT
ncbi:MAG: DUF99 family protein [Crenarchaeota archaeon]|nr:DUF99 family protein [Thermoproteota archaeon]MCR8455127.1 DUF99 family protein [Thermoproteota archaeon]MCR8487276.1 DUF99 family protein [Thermoproteota archaeon]MCR8501468.1 DUF99 family protein [Thermoproteota archaeon]